MPYMVVNEVSTVAAAYAMAGFATDATHVGSSGTALALTGIANAFANAANLETTGDGRGAGDDSGGQWDGAAGGDQYAGEYSGELCEFDWAGSACYDAVCECGVGWDDGDGSRRIRRRRRSTLRIIPG